MQPRPAEGLIMSENSRLAIVAMLVLLGMPACRHEGDEYLAVRKIFPEEGHRLLLNQAIVVSFDRPIDPLSVTRDSIRLVDGQGRVLETERVRVRDTTIEFVPRAPIQPNLEDGSYLPGDEITLEIASYPSPGTLRSHLGEWIDRRVRRTWRVVDGQAMHAEGRLSFLPSLESGSFRLATLPQVSPDGRRVELSFDRPVYPPSLNPLAMRVSERDGGAMPISFSFRPGGRGRARGRFVSLELERPLPASGGVLWFGSSHHGLLDYRLQPILVPQDPTLMPPREGSSLRIQRQASGVSVDGVVESFDRDRRRPRDIDGLGLAFEVEGSLVWSRDGLRMPKLDWPGFRSLGECRPPESTRILRPGAEAEILAGESIRLPEGILDFDRLVIEERHRVVLVLPSTGRLRVRVAGRMIVRGELILRLPSSASSARPKGGDAVVDPRAVWSEIDGHVDFEVAGRVEISGEIRADGGAPGVLAGVLAAHDELAVTAPIDLQLWRLPPSPAGRVSSGQTSTAVPLAGRFIAVSPWYDAENVRSWEGRSIASGAQPGLDIYVQTRRMLPSSRTGPWTFVELLREQGQLEALRFVVAARGHADGALVLKRLQIR